MVSRKKPRLPDGVDVARLGDAKRECRRHLEFYRAQRLDAVRQFVGTRGAKNGPDRPVVLNLLSLYVSTMVRALVGKDPRVMLSTHDQRLKPMVSAAEEWANRQVERMYLGETLQRCVLDALFCIGVAKVSLCDPAQAAMRGWQDQGGVPAVWPVDLDDYVVDVYAPDRSSRAFEGHRYRVPKEAAEDFFRAKIDADSEDRNYNEPGDERIGLLTRDSRSGVDEMEDYVSLWELYLPRHDLVVTLKDDHGTGSTSESDVLKVQPWVGPPCGPYHALYLVPPTPGSVMSKGPVSDVLDLHLAVNNIYRKLIRQAMRQKSVLPYRNAEDVSKLTNTDDGVGFQCDTPNELKELSFGGPNQGLALIGPHLKDLFSWMSGNLDVLAGLSSDADTATQEKLLNANSSRMVSDMQSSVVSWTARVLDSLCWFYWHHPRAVMNSSYSPGGLSAYSVNRQVTPQDRATGSYDDIDVKVDPYSLSHKSPGQRLAFLRSLVQELTPLMPMLSQQGVSFNAKKYVEKVQKYADEPDVAEMFEYQEPAMPPQPGEGEPDMPMPLNSSREYVHRGTGGGQKDRKAMFESMTESGGGEGGFAKALGA